MYRNNKMKDIDIDIYIGISYNHLLLKNGDRILLLL